MPPPSWPPGVRYTDIPLYHQSVPDDVKTFILGEGGKSNTRAKQIPSSRSSSVRIKYISEVSHPAKGQFGLFASRKIPPKTFIIYYIGEVHCEDRLESNYDLSLYRFQSGLSVGVDATTMGNEARFINDFRGIRSRSNAVFADERTPSGELRTSIWSASETIKKGDEILVSYGKSWWGARTVDGRTEAPTYD